jgi:serine/threonine protein kinase
MICPACHEPNDAAAETCFSCGRALSAVTAGTVLGGRFEIRERIGSGGMGSVYLAFDRKLHETVAIKMLRADAAQDPQATRRFKSEIKLARRVNHRNVCRIFEYGEEGTWRYIVMEHVDGAELREVIRHGVGLGGEQAIATAIQIAQGLEAIHDAGIVHRDIKTRNIMRNSRGVVRLMDFGIARRLASADTTTATATGQILGTPEYMSPEQAQGLAVDARSDIYSVGVVIFEMVTGHVPFHGDTPVATLFQQVHQEPPLSGREADRLPPTLVPVLRKALAKDPAARFQTARELTSALRQAWREYARPSEGDTRRAAGAPGANHGARASRRRSASLALVTAGVLVAGLALWVFSREHRGPRVGSESPPPAAPTMEVPTAPAQRTSPPSPRPSPPSAIPATTATPATPLVPTPRRRSQPAARPSSSPPASLRNGQPIGENTPALAASPTTTPTAATELRGILQLTVLPGGDLSLDGNPLGYVVSTKVRLAAGPHVIVLEHPEYQPLRRKITILPDETVRMVLDLAEVGIKRRGP